MNCHVLIVSATTSDCQRLSREEGYMKVTQLLTVEEVANRLGLKTATIRRRILERKIDYVKNGRSVRIPVETVERIIASGYRPAFPGERNG